MKKNVISDHKRALTSRSHEIVDSPIYYCRDLISNELIYDWTIKVCLLDKHICKAHAHYSLSLNITMYQNSIIYAIR